MVEPLTERDEQIRNQSLQISNIEKEVRETNEKIEKAIGRLAENKMNLEILNISMK